MRVSNRFHGQRIGVQFHFEVAGRDIGDGRVLISFDIFKGDDSICAESFSVNDDILNGAIRFQPKIEFKYFTRAAWRYGDAAPLTNPGFM